MPNTASKWPRRSDLTTDLKFVAQMIHDTTFVLPVWASVHSSWKKRLRKRNRPLLDLLDSPQVKSTEKITLCIFIFVLLDVPGVAVVMVRRTEKEEVILSQFLTRSRLAVAAAAVSALALPRQSRATGQASDSRESPPPHPPPRTRAV